MMTMTDDVKSIEKGAVPADTFNPPAGYREVQRRMP
jgi:hypothetical protein